jgi:hypothetical protein
MYENTYRIDASVIRAAMREKNMNVQRLSSRSRIHKNTIRRIIGEYHPKSMKPERMDRARIPTIRSLAWALNISVDEFADLKHAQETTDAA